MKRFLLVIALIAAAGATLPGVASADHRHHGRHGHGHGHGHGHHHGHYHGGYRGYQRPHYDLYWHGDHYDAVPHYGHHYGHHYAYPSYGYHYGGYSRGGINLNGISVRW